MINLDNVYIIMKDTVSPGNIGQAARSMMNFGLKNMILVSPQCEFTDETYSRARYAAKIFEDAPVYDNLDEVAKEIPILVGTSRRGAYRLHMRMVPRLAVEEVDKRYSDVKVGFLFGCEKAGLTNEDLEKCAWYITIPTHPNFESLNVAHSVTVVTYEIFQLARKNKDDDVLKKKADAARLEHLFEHISKFLEAVEFPIRGSADRVNADVRRFISSADVKATDVNLAHGFMRYLEEKYLGGWLEE